MKRRVVLIGAETELGRVCAQALADAGLKLALIAGVTDSDSAFAVKRLGSRLGAAASQAIDTSNEAAVRVMLRQVAKGLGGLDAVVDATGAGYAHIEVLAKRELSRSGASLFVVASSVDDIAAAIDDGAA